MEEKSYPVPCVPFALKLSVWDYCFPPMYSKRLLCFPLPKETTLDSKQQIVTCLYEALWLTVSEIPWLSGTAVPVKDSAWRYEVAPKGAAVLDLKDHTATLNYDHLKSIDFSCNAFDAYALCPLPEFIYPGESPVCRIRANFVKGGMVLTFQISHVLCDGAGIMKILELYSKNFCVAQKGIDSGKATISTPSSDSADHTESRPFSFDRSSVLSGHGVEGDISQHPGWTTLPAPMPPSVRPQTTCASYQINAVGLQELKNTVAPVDAATGKRSTHDAIAVLVWRTLMLARLRAGLIPASRTVHMALAIDCRAQLGLPAPYYGNAIYAIRPSVPLETLLYGGAKKEGEGDPDDQQAGLEGLKIGARIFRDTINDVTADKFRDLVGFVERTEMHERTRLAGIEDCGAGGSMLLISWFRYRPHDLWFGDEPGVGLGRVDAYRLPSNYINPGCPTILPRLPSKDGAEGACEFVFNEPDNVIEWMAKDELFKKFAERKS